MSDLIFPDYGGGSIVNLMSSVIEGCGGTPSAYYPTLHAMDTSLLADADNIVLLVIDGLGYDYLAAQGRDSVLGQHLRSRLTSVAPSTTASAISTFLTGVAPQQHGLTGWFGYFREVGCVLAVLPFSARHSDVPLTKAGISVESLYGHTPVFDGLGIASYVVCPDWIAQSPFNRAHAGQATVVPYQGVEGCFSAIVTTVNQQVGRKYVYAYWPGFDSLAHEHGVGSAAVAAHYQALDEAFARLLEALAGTRTVVMVTADHGFVDVPAQRRLEIGDFEDVKSCLMAPVCGEPRLGYCYVRHDLRDRFETAVREQLGDFVDLYVSGALVDRGLFGLGDCHPELLARVGDYVMVPKEDYVVTDRLAHEGPVSMVGFHGGLSAGEMYVPLVIAQCD